MMFAARSTFRDHGRTTGERRRTASQRATNNEVYGDIIGFIDLRRRGALQVGTRQQRPCSGKRERCRIFLAVMDVLYPAELEVCPSVRSRPYVDDMIATRCRRMSSFCRFPGGAENAGLENEGLENGLILF